MMTEFLQVSKLEMRIYFIQTNNQTSHRQVHQARTHIDNIQPHTKYTTQASREGSNSTKHEGRPPEDGQTIVIETCKVLIMYFTNIYNNLEF